MLTHPVILTEFIKNVMALAIYEKINDPLPYYAEIPQFKGVWAQGRTRNECKKNLQSVLEEWLVLKIRKQQSATTKMI